MAQNRTFQFWGLGYGTSNVSITAMINSTTVYSGPVTTVDQSIDPQPTPLPSEQAVLFTIADSALLNTDFAGSLPMTITVTGGSGVILGEINSNYYVGNAESDPNAGTVNNYSACYVGTPVNSESSIDPRSSVQLNGVTQVPPLPKSLGCWNWFVTSGGNISYNFNISQGQVGNVVGNVANYVAPV